MELCTVIAGRGGVCEGCQAGALSFTAARSANTDFTRNTHQRCALHGGCDFSTVLCQESAAQGTAAEQEVHVTLTLPAPGENDQQQSRHASMIRAVTQKVPRKGRR